MFIVNYAAYSISYHFQCALPIYVVFRLAKDLEILKYSKSFPSRLTSETSTLKGILPPVSKSRFHYGRLSSTKQEPTPDWTESSAYIGYLPVFTVSWRRRGRRRGDRLEATSTAQAGNSSVS